MDSGLLDRLTAALDELADLDVDTLDDTVLHDSVVALGATSTRLEALWCRLIGRWDAHQVWADNGSKAAGARLARETHLRRGDADRLVRRARDLAAMPVTSDAYAAGEVNAAHVDLVASCNRQWRNADFASSEEFLVNLCRTRWFTNAVRGIEHWKLLADRDATTRGHDPVTEGRHLSCSVGWRGEIVINGALDRVGGEVFKSELDRISEQLRLQDLRDGVERTVQQRRADALVEMAMRAATAPADGLRPRPLFTVTIGIEHFKWMCQTAAGTVVAPDLLIPLLSDADIERIVYDPPNRNISASRRQRFTGALRRIIEIRDQRCQHPSGCDEPAVRCDADHIVPRSTGGITCLCNGQLLCAYHNRTVKAARDLATRSARPVLPPRRSGDPLPCPYEPTWSITPGDSDADDTTRAPPQTG
jgi:Domain of unknown function (DUF222)